jgi:hypothetical protein
MKLLPIFTLIVFSSCTFTMNQISTKGTATDVVDETSTPTANVSPSVTIPASLVGK